MSEMIGEARVEVLMADGHQTKIIVDPPPPFGPVCLTFERLGDDVYCTSRQSLKESGGGTYIPPEFFRLARSSARQALVRQLRLI